MLAILLLTAATTMATAQTTTTFTADDNKAAQEEIIKLEFYLASLLEKGDLQTYAGYVTDDYIRISKNGVVATKQQVLESMRGAQPGSMTMKPHDLSVRVYGNTAILNGKLDVETRKDGTVTTSSSYFTKVFIRRDGRWYLANLQGTPLSK